MISKPNEPSRAKKSERILCRGKIVNDPHAPRTSQSYCSWKAATGVRAAAVSNERAAGCGHHVSPAPAGQRSPQPGLGLLTVFAGAIFTGSLGRYLAL